MGIGAVGLAERHRLDPRQSGGAAAFAETVHFQSLRLGAEAEPARLLLDQFRDRAFVAHFGRVLALVADQERHLMRFGGMLAEHERVDRLQLVDEPVSSRKSSARYTVGGAAPAWLSRSDSSRSYAFTGLRAFATSSSTSRRSGVRRKPREVHSRSTSRTMPAASW